MALKPGVPSTTDKILQLEQQIAEFERVSAAILSRTAMEAPARRCVAHIRSIPSAEIGRKLLIRARSVLISCLIDTPADLEKPARRNVIARLIGDIERALQLSEPSELGFGERDG
jgi:hypothetical protein